MKILMLSYGDYDYDGRLRELMRVAESLGEVNAFTRGTKPSSSMHSLYQGSYLGYILKALHFGWKHRDVDVLCLDNRKAVLPGLILRLFVSLKAIVQDCRELYTVEDVKHFAGKVGCLVEQCGIRYADVIICANAERAKFMQEMYHLGKLPLVYENLRQLKYEADFDEAIAEQKYGRYLKTGELRILSTSGCSVSRTNDVLVRELEKVSVPCRLFLIGDSSQTDRKTIEQIVGEHNLSNVEILGRVSQSELKFLISHSHIGIVNYGQSDLNNKFCASGKLYEFIYEGIPVVTTTNPPLKRLCDEAGIGEADDQYADGINRVVSQYETYKERVKEFARENPIGANNQRLAEQLHDILSKIEA